MRRTSSPGAASIGRPQAPRRTRGGLACYGPTPTVAPCAPPTRDARDGHRSATNSRRAGIFTGYYLHNLVQVRDVRSSDGRESVVFGPDVPPVVTGFVLTPAAAPLDRAVVPMLEDMNRDERRLRDLLTDRGYSQLSETGLHHPLRRAGMDLIFATQG